CPFTGCSAKLAVGKTRHIAQTKDLIFSIYPSFKLSSNKNDQTNLKMISSKLINIFTNKNATNI
ncbi:hypothetical protein, partial [Pseudoalteromonas sp.]|uniref:hypothetical protein n=1 Tax=Pseudoalteromonas sp. TaxID=53249 RepID=UPI00257C4FC8